MMDNQSYTLGHKYSLKEYFIKYLLEIRGLKNSSVNHYVDALDSTISNFLVSKGLVSASVFEICVIEELKDIKEILINDPEFHALDERGHRMYSASINRYINFAEGEWFSSLQDAKEGLKKFDEPLPIKEYIQISKIERLSRSYIIKKQVEEAAHYCCEYDGTHHTFIVNKTEHQYMEGHHAIPLHQQKHFANSLDIYANVVCLCPICHRLLHYGRSNDKKAVLSKIYHDRSDRLANCGIEISKSDFMELANS